MKAIVFDAFGGTEVLHEAEIDIPRPGPGQVRVRVRAVGVNPVDGKIRSGVMEAIFPTTLPAVPGGEIAGVVDAVGEDVDHLKVGDEVLGWSDTGSYAQYALASAAVLAPKPPAWTGHTPPPCPWRATVPNACWTCSASPRARRC